jgi:hypothetical protein
MKKLIMLTLMLGLSSNAFAGFLIDPYVGTGSFAGVLDPANAAAEGINDPDDVEESMSAVGSRLGYSFLLFSAGIDYQMLTVDGDSQTNTSAFVGVDLPILFRFWAEYFLSSSVDEETDQSVDFVDGYGLGVGFTGLPFVSINLEAQFLNYEYSTENLGTDYDYDYSTVGYILSVSLPLDL